MTAVVQVFTSGVVSKLVTALSLVLLMRTLPAGEWADYTFAYALVAIVSPMLSLSFNMVFIVGERERTQRDAAHFLAAQLWICSALLCLSLPAAAWDGGVLTAAAVLNLMQCLSEFAKTCFQQQRQFARLSLVEFARAALFLAGIAAAILLYGESITAAGVMYLQAVSLLPVVLAALRTAVDWRSMAHWGAPLRLLADLAARRYRYITGYFVLMAVLSQSTILIIKSLGTENTLANFGAALRVYGLLLLALNSVKVILLPTVQRAENAGEVRAVLQRHCRTIPYFAAAIAAAMLAAPWFMPWLDGGKYHLAPYLLQILCVSVAFSYALSPYASVVMRGGDYRFMFRVMAIALPLSLLGSSVLLLAGGPYAMAWSFVATFAASNLAIWDRARKMLQEEAAAETVRQPRWAA